MFPTQEQVAVLSACASRLPIRTVVPPFSTLRSVQDKHAAFRTLATLGLPQPPSIVAMNERDLADVCAFPVFVKRPISTASSGVRRVVDRNGLFDAARTLGLAETGVLIQDQANGPLVMVQAIADAGRLVAWHANLRTREGAGGGAAAKESIKIPRIGEYLVALVSGLRWHGAISLDAIITSEGPVFIDVNPRLVEPRNAWLAGLDLVETMLALADGRHPAPSVPNRPGVRSHQLLLAILGAAQRCEGRRGVIRELVQWVRRADVYAESIEELTPTDGDPIAAIPVVAAFAVTLLRPKAWRWFVGGSVGPYALTPLGWSQILAAAAPRAEFSLDPRSTENL
jgi:biotin carboxylase